MKKIIFTICTIVCLFSMLQFSEAKTEIFETDYSQDVYKMSDKSEIKLPFIISTLDRLVIDKEVNQTGVFYSSKTLLSESNLKGIQIFCSSDTVTLKGKIENAIVFAPNVVIDGEIERSVYIFANKVTITQTAKIGQDVVVFSDRLETKGTISGNLLGSVKTANIGGTITQDLRMMVTSILMEKENIVSGNAWIETPDENLTSISHLEKAQIKHIEEFEQREVNYSSKVFNMIYTSILFALIFVLFHSKTKIIANMCKKVAKYKIFTVITGLLSFILLPLIILITVFLTIFGLGVIAMPIMLCYILILIIAGMLSTLIVGSTIFEYITHKYEQAIKGPFYQMIGSLMLFLILQLVTLIPYVGFYLSFMIVMGAIGIVVTSIFRRIKE